MFYCLAVAAFSHCGQRGPKLALDVVAVGVTVPVPVRCDSESQSLPRLEK